MKFEQAVARVREGRSVRSAAYAFVPTERRGVTAGGALYVIAFDAEAPKGEDPILVAYMAGLFGSGEGEVEAFTLDDVPEEAFDLDYERTSTYDAELAQYDIEIVLAVLRGATLAESLAAFDAVDRTQGPNATPEALTADLLIAHGFPAILNTPAGSIVAAIVLLDEEDPRLAVLLDAFGGVVVEEDEYDREARRDAVVGDVRDGRRAAGAPSDDEGADGDEGEEEPGEAAWVGVGRGAVLAARLAASALPEWEGDLPVDFADAWRAMLAYVAAAAASPPDAEGRRPKAAYQELRRLSTKIGRTMGRQIADHGRLVDSAADVIAGEIAKGAIGADALALPSGAELEAPVVLPPGLWDDPADEGVRDDA